MVGTRSYFRNVARGAFWGGRKGGFKSIMRRWEEVLGVGEGGYGMSMGVGMCGLDVELGREGQGVREGCVHASLGHSQR